MRIALIIVSAVSLAAVTPATAQDLVVKYDDLDLSTAKGQKSLERRIDYAARDFCGGDSVRTGSRVNAPGFAECVKSARDAAREQVATVVQRQAAAKGG